MNSEKYLQRIAYDGQRSARLEVLEELQKRHLFHVPFENLDIHYGKPIYLKTSEVYDKIINSNRGGFCYELNGLFNELLRALGFNTWLISGRVHEKGNNFGPEFDHMAILVRIMEADYLVDVGFGEFAFAPLKIAPGVIQSGRGKQYTIEHLDHTHYKVSSRSKNTWIPEYIFGIEPRELEEFREMCRYHQTSKNSHFRQQRVCSMPTEYGRKTLTDNRLKVRENGHVKGLKIKDEAEFRKYLKTYFGIVLPGSLKKVSSKDFRSGVGPTQK